MKKCFALLLVLAMVVCLLASCGGKPSNTTKKESSQKSSDTSQTTGKSGSSSDDSKKSSETGAVTPSFKKTMDDYEKFMDDYVAMLKSYQQNPTNLSVLLQYTQMLSQYETVMNEIDAIDEDQLNEADYAYYMTVTVRVTNKLSGALTQ